jgi:folate-dependent phosphoribosylglycinamide formyltransferase PurN
MLQQLKQRWKVNTLNLILILCTFALGGSLCGFATRKLLTLLHVNKGALWVALYILLLTLLWPLCVLIISLPLGQFIFFKKYLKKVSNRFFQKKKPPIKIAIFASGGGSNAQKIIAYFKNHSSITIAHIVCNVPTAGVNAVAAQHQIPILLLNNNLFFNSDEYVAYLQKVGINFIVLAGFLWKIPAHFISAYPNKIVNIHPALLPKYGGKGMYGIRVHEAVLAANEKQTGITIHYVDEQYDHGSTIFSCTCPIEPTDTAISLAQKVLALEHTHFAPVIENVLLKK